MISKSHTRKYILSFLILFLLLILAIQADISRGQGGSIGVDNDGPSFLDISVSETDENIFVNVEVKDLNGWTDIYSVNITIFDAAGRPLSNVSYTQWLSIDSTVFSIKWTETEGDYFDESESYYEDVPIAPWNPDFNEFPVGLRVSFAFDKISGQTIQILCMDKGHMACEYNGPASPVYTPASNLDPTIAIAISAIIAAVASVFVVYARHSNNKFARAVEASHSSPGEE